MQFNFEVPGSNYISSLSSNLVLASNSLPQTKTAAQLLPLEFELPVAGDSIPEETSALELLANIQVPNDLESEREAEFNQLLIFEQEAIEPEDERSAATLENAELAVVSPLIDPEPVRKKTAPTVTSGQPRAATFKPFPTDPAIQDLLAVAPGEALSPSTLADSILKSTPTFEMPPPGSDEFDFTKADQAEPLVDDGLPNQIVPVVPSVSEVAEAIPNRSDAVSPAEVTQTVVDNLVQEVQLTETGEQKRLTLQLHPAELGQVSLQLDWEHDSLKLRIISNEMVTSEILNQNKPDLVSMLAEQGIDFDSLEMSYESPTSEGERQDKNSSSRSLDPEMFASDLTVEVEEKITSNDSSILDITV